ncbi:MAG: SMC family ATPase [Dermatophilaceae bacterium]
MRLHRLAINGFGPFAGSEEVDLDALASAGLFLIHGPTGAGKSSILDAICFALYAAVPGDRAGSRASLRSHHAAEGVIPEVTLDFTASGRRLRVCRSPEFSRAKKRGAGETTVPAKVVLEEFTEGAWSCRGTRHDEVALALKDILGMGLEQFSKVVLLPQGDFAAFLRASPEVRRSVLEKLFDTRRFTDVETWLVERRRLAASALGSARGQLATGLLRVDDVMARLEPGDDIVAPAWLDVPDAEVEGELARLVAAVDLRASIALAGVEVARVAVASSESAVQHGLAVVGHQQTAAEASANLATLEEQHGAYLDAVRAVERAARAAAVSGFVVATNSANRLREAAKARVADLRAPLVLIFNDGIGAGSAADIDVAARAIAPLIDRVAGHSDGLQEAVAQASRARELSEESARHRQAALLEDEASAAFARQRAEAEGHRGGAELSTEAGRSAVAALAGLEARHKSLTRIEQLLADQACSLANLETLQGHVNSAELLWLGARERLLDLRERRLAGMAAELADGLSAGGPCPVCGSCAHPMPATTTDPVSSANIAVAEGHQEVAAEALSVVRSKVIVETAGQKTRASELAADQLLGSTASASDVHAALLVAAAAIAEARTAADALPQAQAQMVSLTKETERLRGLIEQKVAARALSLSLATSTGAQAHRAEADAASSLASHGRSCPCRSGDRDRVTVGDRQGRLAGGSELTDHIEIAGELSHHRQTLAHLRSLGAGFHELVTHEANAREADIRLSKALQDSGFETLSDAQAAVTQAQAAELTAFLRAHEQQLAQAKALLAQPEVVAALELATPDVNALAQAHALAAASLADAGRRHTLSEQAQRDLRALSSIVGQASRDLGPAAQEASLVQELADCVAGNSADNALRMRLSSYVLAARLDEIATLANERLGTMTDGRYTLEYTDARAAKGARSGLGLLVRDAWTGRSRETSSLSGGEAFMASLALALGLGDAVRAEAGGFDLKTLFVDEGFGSLDEDSLEQVMAVLDTLREGGRAVGIVSHVTELRARIPQQLQVIKGHSGSTIRVDSNATSVA